MFQIPLPLAQLVLSAVNHVTRQQPLLRHALQAHAGQVLRINVIPPGPGGQQAATAASTGPRTGRPGTQAPAGSLLPTLQADARIGADGSLSAVSGDEPSVTLTARLSTDALFKVLQQGPLALGASLRIEGDVMLATALGDVAKALHWDLEEDLSKVVGDVAAHRAGSLWREGRVHVAEVAARAQELLGAHLASDRGVLASLAEARQMAADLHQLETRIAALERRAVALGR